MFQSNCERSGSFLGAPRVPPKLPSHQRKEDQHEHRPIHKSFSMTPARVSRRSFAVSAQAARAVSRVSVRMAGNLPRGSTRTAKVDDKTLVGGFLTNPAGDGRALLFFRPSRAGRVVRKSSGSQMNRPSGYFAERRLHAVMARLYWKSP